MESSASIRPVFLVTGAYGLLGRRVVPLLAEKIPGCRIIAVGRGEAKGDVQSPQVEVARGDLRDASLWAGLPRAITHVVHLAAVIPWKVEERDKASVVTDNLSPLANLIEHSRRWDDLRQIIYSSSVSVYTQTGQLLREDSPCHPATLYGASKLAGEKLLCSMEARGVRVVSLRLSSLYAHGQYEGTVLPVMINRARQKQELLVHGDGTRTQDFLHCDDAARAHLLSFEKQARGVYNVGSGTSVTMTELAQTVSRIFADAEARIVHQPEKSDGDAGLKLDISKARRELDYQPSIDLESGLRQLKREMESITE
jgi:UDP-glucose 4-epimerase